MAHLRIKVGPLEGKTFNLDKDLFVIGRESGDLVIDDKAASRKHCEIFKIGEMFFVRDLASRNGTYINDQEVQEEILQMGDKLRVGGTIFIFEDESVIGDHFDEDDLYHENDEMNSTMIIDMDPHAFGNSTTGSTQSILTFFNRVSRTLVQEENLDDILKETAVFVRDYLKADLVAVFIQEKDEPKPRVVLGQDSKMRVSASIVKRVLQQRKGLLSHNAMEDVRFNKSDSILMHQVESFIAVPLVAHENYHGVFYLARSAYSGSFNEDDLEKMTIIGYQIGPVIENLLAQKKQKEIFVNTIKLLTSAIEGGDPKRSGQAQRVMNYAVVIAEELRMSEEDIRQLQIAALLHDIGRLDPRLKKKPSEDPLLMAKYGAQMLSQVPGFEAVARIVEHQMERYDGSGPLGLKGDEISLAGAIVGLSVDFDTRNTKESPEGKVSSLTDVLKSFYRKANLKYQGRLIKALLTAQRKGRLYTPDLISFGG
jgi:HD-GYP domain-containing protein (c-di-GMP phosphodiesterase class II)